MKIGTDKFAIRAKVVSNLHEIMILGSDLFRKNCAKIGFENLVIKLRGNTYPLSIAEDNYDQMPFINRRSTKILKPENRKFISNSLNAPHSLVEFLEKVKKMLKIKMLKITTIQLLSTPFLHLQSFKYQMRLMTFTTCEIQQRKKW